MKANSGLLGAKVVERPKICNKSTFEALTKNNSTVLGGACSWGNVEKLTKYMRL